jgi:hypothetical protein
MLITKNITPSSPFLLQGIGIKTKLCLNQL